MHDVEHHSPRGPLTGRLFMAQRAATVRWTCGLLGAFIFIAVIATGLTSPQTAGSALATQSPEPRQIGSYNAFAGRINEAGLAAGFSSADIGALNAWRPAVFDVNTGSEQMLPSPPFTPGGGQVDGLNDVGQVFGSWVGGGFVWDLNSQTIRYLNGPGGAWSRVTDINNYGIATGFSWVGSTLVGVRWDLADGIPTTIGSLGGNNTAPYDINDAGFIVGSSYIANGDQHAFVWDPTTRVMRDLGLVGADNGAMAINESNQVAAWGSATGSIFRTYLIDAASGSKRNIGGLGGNETFPHGMNNLGQIVGRATTPDELEHPFVWDPAVGTLIRLTDIGNPLALPSDSEGDGFANDINDAGQIVGINNEWVPTGIGGGSYTRVHLEVWDLRDVAEPPQIDVGQATITEPDAGHCRSLRVPVTLTRGARTVITANYSVASINPASNGTSVPAATGTIRFAPGRSGGLSPTIRWINICVAPDLIPETDEVLDVELSDLNGDVVPGRVTNQSTVFDNDAEPTDMSVSVGDVSISEGDAASGLSRKAWVSITLSRPAPAALTIRIVLADGTAVSSVDFKPRTTEFSVTFSRGQRQRFIAIPILPDYRIEFDENLTVNVEPAPGLLIERGVATVSIENDD